MRTGASGLAFSSFDFSTAGGAWRVLILVSGGAVAPVKGAAILLGFIGEGAAGVTELRSCDRTESLWRVSWSDVQTKVLGFCCFKLPPRWLSNYEDEFYSKSGFPVVLRQTGNAPGTVPGEARDSYRDPTGQGLRKLGCESISTSVDFRQGAGKPTASVWERARHGFRYTAGFLVW